MERRDAVDAILAAVGSPGGHGTSIVVEGPLSSAAHEVLTRVADTGDRAVARAGGRWAERQIPYGVLRDLLRRVATAIDLPEGVAHVLAVLGVAGSADGDVDAPAVCHASFAALESASDTAPVLLLVDDLQWVDAPSLFVLAYVARRIMDLPCCLVATVATPLPPDSPATAVVGAAEHRFELPAALSDDAHDDLETLRRRLAECSAHARRVARSMAVLGGAPDVPLLASTIGQSIDDAAGAVAELRDAVLLEGPLALCPELAAALQDGGPETFTLTVRAAEALARRGEAERAANLIASLPPIDEPWAAPALAAAAHRAASAGEDATAVSLYERTLREASAQRGDLSLALATVRRRMGQLRSALDSLAAAADAGVHHNNLGFPVCALALEATVAGDLGTADQALRHGISWADTDDGRVLVAATAKTMSAITGVSSAGVPEIDARRLAGATPAERFALAVDAFHTVQAGGSLAEAAGLAIRAAASGLLAQDSDAAGGPAFLAADVLVDAEEFDLATSLLDAMVARAERTGDVSAFHRYMAFRSYAQMLMGQVAFAESDALLALDGSLTPVDEMLAAGALVEALLERGAVEEAASRAEGYLSRLAPASTSSMVLYAAARVAAAQADHQRALDLASQLHEIERQMSRVGVPVLWRSVAAVSRAAVGEASAGLRLAAEEVEIAERTGHRRGLVLGLLAKAAIVAGDERSSLLESALTQASLARSPLIRARALAAYGGQLRRLNRAVDARDPLREAVALASNCGASALALDAESELRAAGARPRRTQTTGPASLTPMERRVTAAARTGRSNADIAAALFITRKTVEMHLSRAYRKLGITSRNDLHGLDLE